MQAVSPEALEALVGPARMVAMGDSVVAMLAAQGARLVQAARWEARAGTGVALVRGAHPVAAVSAVAAAAVAGSTRPARSWRNAPEWFR